MIVKSVLLDVLVRCCLVLNIVRGISPQSCSTDNECTGWNAVCQDKTCTCKSGFKLSTNKVDCVDTVCGANCLTCLNQNTCQRCLHYMNEASGQCIEQCSGTYSVSLAGDRQGKICSVEATRPTLSDTQLTIVFCVCGGVLCTVILVLAFYCHVRQKHGKFEFEQREIIDAYSYRPNRTMRMIPDGSLMNGHTGVYSIHPDPNNIVMARVVSHQEKEEFMNRLYSLQPRKDNILAMISDARRKGKVVPADSMAARDSRNVVQQLCRVLTLLTKKDAEIIMPEDGIKLLKWARQILNKYLMSIQNISMHSSEDSESQSRMVKSTGNTDYHLSQLPCYVTSTPSNSISNELSNNVSEVQLIKDTRSIIHHDISESHSQSEADSDQSPRPVSVTVTNQLRQPVKRQISNHCVELPFSTFGYERVTDTESLETTLNPIPKGKKYPTLPRNFVFNLADATESVAV